MRVLMLSSDIGVSGGAEVFASNLASALAQISDITVELEFARVSPVKLKSLLDVYNPFSGRLCRKQLGLERFDIVHVHNFYGLSTDILRLIDNEGVPLVWTVHDYRIVCPKGSLTHRDGAFCDVPSLFCQALLGWKVRNIPKVKAVVCPSRFMQQVVANYLGVPTMVVPNGAQLPMGLVKTTPRCDRPIVLGFMGRLTREKGIGLLCEQFCLLKRNDMELQVAGMGPLLDDLKQKYENEGAGPIKFMGHLGSEEKWKWLSEIDALVVPSQWPENAPLVVYEALAVGTPVLANSVGGLTELIQDGVNGYVVRDSIDNLLRILTKESLLALRSQLDKLPFRSISDVASDYADIYRQLLKT